MDRLQRSQRVSPTRLNRELSFEHALKTAATDFDREEVSVVAKWSLTSRRLTLKGDLWPTNR